MREIIELIIKERERQILEKGYDAPHDNAHENQELAVASVVYISASISEEFARNIVSDLKWNIAIRPDDYEGNLIKACALLVAELQRIKRLK